MAKEEPLASKSGRRRGGRRRDKRCQRKEGGVEDEQDEQGSPRAALMIWDPIW